MRPAFSVLAGPLLLLNFEAVVHVQTVPQTQFNNRDTEQQVIVEGCLFGKRFKPDMTSATNKMIFGTLDAEELRLEGSPEVMRGLEKQHDGHQDVISGVVYVPPDRDVRVKSEGIGPRTVVTATAEGPSTDPRTPAPSPGATRRPASGSRPLTSGAVAPVRSLRMKVTSLRHVSDKCSVPMN